MAKIRSSCEDIKKITDRGVEGLAVIFLLIKMCTLNSLILQYRYNKCSVIVKV